MAVGQLVTNLLQLANISRPKKSFFVHYKRILRVHQVRREEKEGYFV
jgi:hypothetical protein